MKIFVLFEESARVRDAFRALGHDATSIDILATRGDPANHIRLDIWHKETFRWIENHRPDIVIAFPPCTHLCNSGNRYHAGTPERLSSLANIKRLLKLKVARLAIENPIGFISSFRKPDQIIQPWQFGHPESKSTCLWLNGLPVLIPTNILPLPESGRWDNQTPSGQNNLGPSEHRARIRSETYQGIADAMAAQWGNI